MTLKSKTITRTLQYEILDTHVAGCSVLFTRWEDTPAGMKYALGPRPRLEAQIKTLSAPGGKNIPIKEGDKDQLWYPYFVNEKDFELIKANAGHLSSRVAAAITDYRPKTWGELPAPDMMLLGFCGYDNTFVHPDGRYAVTTLYDDICLDGWNRSKLMDLLASREVPIDIVRPPYHVPGNGLMVDMMITLTEEQYAKYQAERRNHWSRLGFALTAFGYDLKDYRSADD